MPSLVIYGAGGSGVEALWIAREMVAAASSEWQVVGFVDDNPDLSGSTVDGVPVTSGADIKKHFQPDRVLVHLAIGANKQRRRVAERLAEEGYRFATLIHPSAIVASSATIAEGTMVGPMSVIAPHVEVGRHVLVNSHVGVGHHSRVHDYAQLCPGVRVGGFARIHEGVFVGSNAVILPSVEVAEGATVGACSVVIRRVAPRHSVMGVPARILSRPAETESTAHPQKK